MCFSETNPWTMNSLLHNIRYSHSFRQKLFRCKPTTNILFQFYQKPASPAKQRRKIDSPKRRITVYTIFLFHLLFVGVSSLFVNSVYRTFQRRALTVRVKTDIFSSSRVLCIFRYKNNRGRIFECAKPHFALRVAKNFITLWNTQKKRVLINCSSKRKAGTEEKNERGSYFGDKLKRRCNIEFRSADYLINIIFMCFFSSFFFF